MNKINVQQTGGFPLETDTLNAMQTAYDIFNSLGNIIAPLAIVKGCEITGNQVANGIVFINGEVFEFRGGQASATVIIKEETTNRNFENGENKVVYRTRYATFGNSVQTTNYNWSDFHRSISMKEIEKRLVHPGFIQDYYGDVNSIPTGWYLCDGTNGTPDLRGMFIVGFDSGNSDYNQIGKTGGVEENTPSVNLQESIISLSIPRDGWGVEGSKPSPSTSIASGRLVVGSGAPELGEDLESIRAAGNNLNATNKHTHDISVAKLDNRPPFYVLAKIMYKG